MSHTPTSSDIAADLIRCIHASYSDKGFKDENVAAFLTHAQRDLRRVKKSIPAHTRTIIETRLKKSTNTRLSPYKRREDMLTAAVLLAS